MTDIATITIAIMVASIGFLQYLNNRKLKLISEEKLKLDLFEKRFKVYQATKDVIPIVTADETPNFEALEDFNNKTSEAVFLFDESLHDYLDDIYKNAYVLSNIKFGKGFTDITKELPAQVVKDEALALDEGERGENEIKNRLWDRSRELEEVFAPYLRFKTWK
ncbi:MAG: hypothetical protein ACE5GV_13460 [Candidatus Scalindua sp.]